MTLGVVVLSALAGGLGAAVRYLLDVGVARVWGTRFPWGVLVINVSGSFALGVGVGLLPDAATIVGAGFLGGYTTFSTAMVDTIALWRDGSRGAAVFNAVGMLVLGLAAAAAGLFVGRLL